MSLLKVIVQAIRERRLPMFAWSRDGTITAKCPRCRAPIALSKMAAEGQAFKCPACGEEATWKADASP